MIIIVDSKVNYFKSPNDIFNKNIALEPGMTFWPIFFNEATKKGYKVYELQEVIKSNLKFDNAYGISFEGGSMTNFYFSKYNIKKSIVFTAESPNVALKFYRNLNTNIDGYKNVFLFSGCQSYINNTAIKFHSFYFPSDKIYSSGKSFGERNLLCYIASAKSNMPVNYSSIASRFIRKFRYIFYSMYRKKSPILKNCVDLYKMRFFYIKSLSNYKNFFLYGRGWDLALKYDKYFKNVTFYNKPHNIDNKHVVIENFKFVLCFENADFEGYITEKIFDAMLNGSVPIYYGTDTINKLVPTNCFLNAKNFSNANDLIYYLENVDQNIWQQYRSNIFNYLNSDKYNLFKSKNLALNFLNCVKYES